MKSKLTTMLAVLLLAVGWPSDASAQLIEAKKADATHPSFTKQMKQKGDRHMSLRDLIEAPVKDVVQANSSKFEYEDDINSPEQRHRAPLRAVYNETANVIHDYAWYDSITYSWTNGSGTYTSRITEPATDPYQMAYLVGTTYMNPKIPGIKYTEGKRLDHPYMNIAYAYDIPANARWYVDAGGTPIGDITINIANGNLDFTSITVTGNNGSTSWNYTKYGTSLPDGWTTTAELSTETDDGTECAWISGGGTITVPASLLNGSTSATVTIYAQTYNYQYSSCAVTVNGQSQTITNYSTWQNYTWNVSNTTSQTSVTPPNENGYTVFIAKLKDGVHDNNEPEHTNTWASLISYFDTYFESLELLTDGVRVGASTAASDAGTMFSYTGNLNKFFFISKGKMYYLDTDRAPFYSMYEEFSPTTTQSGDEITDFFERMDNGEAYDVIHDCQSVNYMEHFFSMTGKDGSTHNTMSNLIFYIPDDRGQYGTRNYDHKPRVGLYTCELEATATPNPSQEHVYDVTCDWSSSLETILGFDEPEWYDLWVVVKDEQGNVVLDSLLTTTDQTTYTYQVPQYPESYTIDYLVRAWPKSGPDPVDHNAESAGTFFADSDPDDVLIPGYKDFISIIRHHYESDFDIDTEFNYYRNFMSLGNQNGTNGLTTARIDRGENVLHLFRYDYDNPTNETEAATLEFTHTGNQVTWEITYNDQQYYPKHNGGESKYSLTTMKIPTSGFFTVGSGTGSDITIVFGGSTSSDGTNTGGNFNFSSIQVKSGGSVIPGCSWTYATHQTSVPTGWIFNPNTSTTTFNRDGNTSYCYISKGGSLTIPYSMLNGATTVQVVITGNCADGYTSYPATISVNGSDGGYGSITSTTTQDYTWTVNTGYSEDDAIDVSGIQFVDQFRASTAEDKHPYRYGYRLEYTGRGTAEWDTTKVSNVLIVPVKHSGSTLNGFYTFDEMIHDSIPELLQTNVKNGDLSMTLGGDNEIFYYTINRRPDDGNAWDRMSYMQFDNNHTFYTEGVNYLPQYFGSTNYPGDMIERLDNANVLTDDYNSYMKYGPVVWTYGYDRFYYDTKDLPSGLTADGYHNSYGAPVWKTGVGDVNLNGLQVQRQTKANGEDNPSTSWKDEYGADCSLYFLGITADGILPTTNMKGEGGSNYYEPYMFRVWVKSNSGALRGFTPVSDSQGDHIVNNATLDHSMQVVYEEYTNSTVLYKPIPEQYTNARNIIKFGALKDVNASDLEVIVRFYYKVKHLDPVDNSQDNIVTLDFTANEWQIPVGNTSNWQTGSADYTTGEGDDALTINLANKYYYNEAVGFLMLGQNGTLTLPAFDRKVKQIQVVGRPGASSSVKMNVFVGNDAASTEVTGSTGTSIFDIAEQYQQVGTQYTIKVDNNYNAQIAQVIVIFDDQQTNGMMMRAPQRAGESHTSTLNFTAKCNGSGTADDGTVWTVTSDGTESDFDNTKGIHYGTNSATVQYVNLSTSGIEGTIKQIVVNASTASGVSANLDVTVGGQAFGQQQTLTSTATDYTFTGSATGDIVVSIHKPSNAKKALYCKSIVVTYETEGGQIVTAELTAPESGSTINVGTNTGNGVSVPVTISGSNLTEDLTVSVSGTGFSVSPATVTAAAANAGVSVTVTYNGTDANATGTLTISSNEVNATVNLTASYDGGTTPPAGDAELVAPVDGSTVFVGTITAEGESVSIDIPISGNNLTKDLTASIMGAGFSFLTRDITIPYADVNAGTAKVTVAYNGTAPEATGRLTLRSDEVTAVVNLTASFRLPVVLTNTPAGYVAQDSAKPDRITTSIIETLFDQTPAEVVSVTYVNSLGMASDKPFDGINIVVTRYSDGTSRTTKVVR